MISYSNQSVKHDLASEHVHVHADLDASMFSGHNSKPLIVDFSHITSSSSDYCQQQETTQRLFKQISLFVCSPVFTFYNTRYFSSAQQISPVGFCSTLSCFLPSNLNFPQENKWDCLWYWTRRSLDVGLTTGAAAAHAACAVTSILWEFNYRARSLARGQHGLHHTD